MRRLAGWALSAVLALAAMGAQAADVTLRVTGGALPGWVIAKLVIWLVVTGLGHLVAKRFPAQAAKAFWLTIALAIVAACLAIYKPF